MKNKGLLALVNKQAEDDGLWFFPAQTAPEAYLQQELRKLHAAVEALLSEAETLAVVEVIANRVDLCEGPSGITAVYEIRAVFELRGQRGKPIPVIVTITRKPDDA